MQPELIDFGHYCGCCGASAFYNDRRECVEKSPPVGNDQDLPVRYFWN
jgi:hypothetical protein